MAEITYQARLKDTSGAPVATFAGMGRERGGMVSLYYHKRLRTPGSFILRIDGNDKRTDLFGLDYQVEFWRRDRRGGLDWYLDFEGFHRSWELTQDDEGRNVFVSRGRGYNDLLAAEPIRYASGSDYACKVGPVETAAKAFVDENIGPGATSPPRDAVGVMPGLTIAADAGSGMWWGGCRSNKNLLDVLKELAEYGPGDYMIVGAGPATFQFQWRDVRWGQDKTQGNADDRPPVVFDPAHGNATNLAYNYSRLEEVNVVYVLGQGVGDERAIVTCTSGAEADSPWARRAVARDARDEEDETLLAVRGDELLDEQRARRKMAFDARQTAACRYRRDWDWGDLVTIQFRGMTFDQKIIGVAVGMSEDGVESIQPEMEDE